MTALADFQQDFRRAILDGGDRALAGLLRAPFGDPVSRIGIYRTNTFNSLTRALMDNFPVTVRLLDERFFAHAADLYIRRHPPRDPRLDRYGAGFPRFLSRLPACADFPFVAPVAALERAIVEALTAPELRALKIGVLSSGGGAAARLTLQPSLRFVVSRWPALAIWRAHQEGGDPSLGVARKAARVAVYRAGAAVRFRELEPASFAFLRALGRRDSLERAADRALRRDRSFNLLAELVGLFGGGLVAGLDPSNGKDP